MSEVLGKGAYRLRASSQNVPFTNKFIADFKAGLPKLEVRKVDGLVVMAASHKNYYGEMIPWRLFKDVEPSPRLTELFGKVKEQINDIEAEDAIVRIGKPKYKKVGHFISHFNPFRGLRPPGAAKMENLPIDMPFPHNDPKAFHFGKINEEEIFTKVIMNGKKIELLYNLFPFAPFHFLLVPDRGACLPQSLADAEQLKLAWYYLKLTGDPNLRLAFNSLGAYASAPHMHWQGFYNTEGFRPPIDKAINQAPKGVTELSEWPIKGTTVIKGDDTFVLKETNLMIQSIIARAKASPNTIAFNLYMRPDSITIIPRKHQSAMVDYINNVAKFTTGPAFFESIGIMIMPSRDHYNGTTEEQLRALYQYMSI